LAQHTIAEKISCTGRGLHSGASAQLTLHPARADSGIVFVRSDLPHPVEIPACPDSVASVERATTLGRGDATIGTVEHLLSALYALGIDNVRAEVDGPEVPVMDGSAAPFVRLLQRAGTLAQRAPRPCLRIRKPIEVRRGAHRIRVEPSRYLRIQYALDYPHPAIGRQQLALLLDSGCFERELAGARTFGFLHEVEALHRAGLARGGSLQNTVVLDGERVLNADGLRWPDEFVRHKALDLLGDLALLGVPVRGRFVAERGGHALHQALVRKIAATPSAWSLEGVPEARAAAPAFASPAPLRATA